MPCFILILDRKSLLGVKIDILGKISVFSLFTIKALFGVLLKIMFPLTVLCVILCENLIFSTFWGSKTNVVRKKLMLLGYFW